jgi:mono/diheme cytochrome c family protein
MAERLEGLETFARENVSTHLTAWDPVAQKRVWRVELGQGIPSGVLATGGGLVFQGTTWGKLRAYAAETGAQLWENETGTGIIAPPISYEIDGEQYVAIVAGLGGSQGGHYVHFTNPNPGRILAFKLDAHSPLPPMPPQPAKPGTEGRPVEAPVINATPETLARGRALYAQHCTRCHGVGVHSSGLYPDLRQASADVFASWRAIVLGGAFSSHGMASFADVLTPDDADAIRAYVANRAHHEASWAEWISETLSGRFSVPAKWLAN